LITVLTVFENGHHNSARLVDRNKPLKRFKENLGALTPKLKLGENERLGLLQESLQLVGYHK
jgi:hypothetical protein